MSKMAELDMEIRIMLNHGSSPEYIARTLDIPVEMVDDVMESIWDEQYSPFATANS
jgi:hypothetical protein